MDAPYRIKASYANHLHRGTIYWIEPNYPARDRAFFGLFYQDLWLIYYQWLTLKMINTININLVESAQWHGGRALETAIPGHKWNNYIKY